MTGRPDRGQSAVVGVALLLGTTVVGIGLLVGAGGAVIEEGVATAQTDRVAESLDDALDPAARTGARRSSVRVADGRLRVVNRTVRVLNDTDAVWVGHAGGVVVETGEGDPARRVAAVAGAVTTGRGDASRLDAPPSVAPATGTLYVGVPVLNSTGAEAVSAESTALSVTLRTNVSHERRDFPPGQYRVAVETSAPGAWERHLAERAAETTRRDFDGDGVPSVVASFEGARTVRLVVHETRLEVT
jgi:hypothetical protein